MFDYSIDELLEDTDSEMEDDSKEKKKKKQHAKTSKAPEKGGKAWLHEGDSEIMDFMDVSAAKKVMGKSVLAEMFQVLTLKAWIKIVADSVRFSLILKKNKVSNCSDENCAPA